MYSCKCIYLTKDGKRWSYTSTKTSPIYAYKEYDEKHNFIGWRIYFPYEEKGKKWINNSDYTIIQGIKGLNSNRDLIILTKSRKDCLVYKKLGFNAIAPPSENGKLSEGIVKLLKEFNRVVINFDNDEAGINAAQKIKNVYGWDTIYMDEYKDVSDYIEVYNIEETKNMICGKLKRK